MAFFRHAMLANPQWRASRNNKRCWPRRLKKRTVARAFPEAVDGRIVKSELVIAYLLLLRDGNLETMRSNMTGAAQRAPLQHKVAWACWNSVQKQFNPDASVVFWQRLALSRLHLSVCMLGCMSCFLSLIFFQLCVDNYSNVRPCVPCAATPTHKDAKCRQPGLNSPDHGRTRRRAADQQRRCVRLEIKRQRQKNVARATSCTSSALIFKKVKYCRLKFPKKKKKGKYDPGRHVTRSGASAGQRDRIVAESSIAPDTNEGLLATP